MFKHLSVLLLAFAVFGECSIVKFSNSHNSNNLIAQSESEWEAHAKDFLKLIDIQKLMGIAIKYMSDPEVMKFIDFLYGPEFKKLVWEIEIMPEFREAYGYLKLKGFDFGFVFEFINKALDMPPFEPHGVFRDSKGIAAVFEEMMSALPLQEMKKLFEEKLETSPEISELFSIINSEEYLSIIRRISEDPEFIEIKNVFKLYGFDFGFICSFAKGIFGANYEGIFCV